VGKGEVVVGLERGGYIEVEQKTKTWTPIPYILAMQHLAQKDGSPDFLFARFLLVFPFAS
jgi:hypothetical protein